MSRFANQRTVKLKSKETRKDREVLIDTLPSITLGAYVVIKGANVADECKDTKINSNTEWGRTACSNNEQRGNTTPSPMADAQKTKPKQSIQQQTQDNIALHFH